MVREKAVATWEWLQGKKTYIASTYIFLVGGLYLLDVIGDEFLKSLITIGTAMFGVAVRSALKKLE